MVGSTISIGKPVEFKVDSSGITNSRVVVYNRTTGEYCTKDDKGAVLRIPDTKRVTFDAEWFESGWSVGDVLEITIGGKVYGSATVTLTAASATLQRVDVTTASSALSAGGL